MNTTADTAKARKAATIEVAVCEDCFCAVPREQAETHSKWHEDRRDPRTA